MTRTQVNWTKVSLALRGGILVCSLLIALAALAQAAHFHANELSSDVGPCTICQVAHAPAQATPVPDLSLGLATVAFVTFATHCDFKPALTLFPFFSRPPPMV